MPHGPSVFYDDNTGYLILDELHDSANVDDDGNPTAYVNNATVTCEGIRTLAGVMLTGMTFPVAMPYVTSSSGKYRVKVSDTLTGVPNETTVEAHVKVVVATDIANFRLRFPFKLRVV
jgi:hypothetical protein